MIFIMALFFMSVGTALAKSFVETFPKQPDPTKKYIIYLHGTIVEGDVIMPIHPVFGLYDMPLIRNALGDMENSVLISAQRQKRTKAPMYARKVAYSVLSLLEAGVLAKNITIAGFSKGGHIAIHASGILNNDQINFVFMAACNNWAFKDDKIKVAGRILSILESSDNIGISCKPLIDKSTNVKEYKEIILNTGKKHGAFYQPIPEWVEPLKAWASQ